MASDTSSADKKMPWRSSSLRTYLGFGEAGKYLRCTQVIDRGSGKQVLIDLGCNSDEMASVFIRLFFRPHFSILSYFHSASLPSSSHFSSKSVRTGHPHLRRYAFTRVENRLDLFPIGTAATSYSSKRRGKPATHEFR